jgi:CheY-like chemotaxis protein
LPVDGKVLLAIEDNEGIVRVFQGYLATYGYVVMGATSGDEALRLAREVSPIAITLDIMMPTQDGWEILQVLKSDPATRSIPVIICSVLEDPQLARSLGAVAYLQKPISQADLLDVLSRLPGGS